MALLSKLCLTLAGETGTVKHLLTTAALTLMFFTFAAFCGEFYCDLRSLSNFIRTVRFDIDLSWLQVPSVFKIFYGLTFAEF